MFSDSSIMQMWHYALKPLLKDASPIPITMQFWML